MESSAARQKRYYEGMVHFRTINGRVVAFSGPDPARSSGTQWAKLRRSASSPSGAELVGKSKPVSQAGKISQVHSAKIRAGQFRVARNAPVGTGRGTQRTVASMSKLKTAVRSLIPKTKKTASVSAKEQAASTRSAKGSSVARIQSMVKTVKSRIASTEHSMSNNPLVGGVRQDRAQFQSDIKRLKRLEATLARLNKMTQKRREATPGYNLRTGGYGPR